MPITTKVVSWNPINGEMYSMQHYMIKFVSDLRQVGGFLRFPITNKADLHDITEILLKVMLSTIKQTIKGENIILKNDFVHEKDTVWCIIIGLFVHHHLKYFNWNYIFMHLP